MKVLILDGTRAGESGFDVVRASLAAQFEALECDVTTLTLRELEIHHCIGCFGCWVETPGECLIDDPARDVARAFINADLVVFVTPVTFGGYSSELKKALDRIICLVSPMFTRIDGETHHKGRYARYPSLLAVGLQAGSDSESREIFMDLLDRNAINMHTPVHKAIVIDPDVPGDTAAGELTAFFETVEACRG